MDKNLEGLEEFSLAYIDDKLIFTKNDKEDHLSKLLIVLERCKEKGLILSEKKAILCKQTINFLGLTISQNGNILLQDNVLEKVSNFPNKIEDRKQLQRFLGCINYIAQQGFLKDIATKAKDFHKKISLSNPWK